MGPPPSGSDIPGYFTPGNAGGEYLKSLWVKTGTSRGIDEGIDQGEVDSVIGSNGRSKLGDMERVLPYQVVISFPGADFNFTFTDEDGVPVASGGAALADALRSWIMTETWARYGGYLVGSSSEAVLLSHFYMDKTNLEYCPGTTRVKNYRQRGPDSIASINPNWKFYYVEAQMECTVMLVLITVDWLKSPNCLGELDDIKDITKKKANSDDAEMMLIVLEDGVYSHPQWGQVEEKGKSWGAEFHKYTPSTDAGTKGAVEQAIFNLIDNRCQLKRVSKPSVPSSVKYVDWDEAAMGQTQKI